MAHLSPGRTCWLWIYWAIRLCLEAYAIWRGRTSGFSRLLPRKPYSVESRLVAFDCMLPLSSLFFSFILPYSSLGILHFHRFYMIRTSNNFFSFLLLILRTTYYNSTFIHLSHLKVFYCLHFCVPAFCTIVPCVPLHSVSLVISKGIITPYIYFVVPIVNNIYSVSVRSSLF